MSDLYQNTGYLIFSGSFDIKESPFIIQECKNIVSRILIFNKKHTDKTLI